jgi:mannose-6-phosphate isomerase-like protein (cupin superfamily)
VCDVTLIVEAPRSEQSPAWWFLDTLVVEHRGVPGFQAVVMEMTLPVGSTPPLHVHHDLDDTWYILDGDMAVRCGDDQLAVGAGFWVSMPRDVPHTFRVVGDRPARILLVHDRPSFRDFVRALSVPAGALVVPEAPFFPPMDEVGRAAAAHDLTPVGPPMTAEEAGAVLAAAR